MADHIEAIGVLVALEFVVMTLAVLAVVPFEVAAPLVPLFLVFAYVLYAYST